MEYQRCRHTHLPAGGTPAQHGTAWSPPQQKQSATPPGNKDLKVVRELGPAPAHTEGTADMTVDIVNLTVDIVNMTTDTSTDTATVGAMMAQRKAVSIAPTAARDSRSDPESFSDRVDLAAIATSTAGTRVMPAPASVLLAHGERAAVAEAAVLGAGGTYARPSWSCSTSSRGTGTS